MHNIHQKEASMCWRDSMNYLLNLIHFGNPSCCLVLVGKQHLRLFPSEKNMQQKASDPKQTLTVSATVPVSIVALLLFLKVVWSFANSGFPCYDFTNLQLNMLKGEVGTDRLCPLLKKCHAGSKERCKTGPWKTSFLYTLQKISISPVEPWVAQHAGLLHWAYWVKAEGKFKQFELQSLCGTICQSE